MQAIALHPLIQNKTTDNNKKLKQLRKDDTLIFCHE